MVSRMTGVRCRRSRRWRLPPATRSAPTAASSESINKSSKGLFKRRPRVTCLVPRWALRTCLLWLFRFYFFCMRNISGWRVEVLASGEVEKGAMISRFSPSSCSQDCQVSSWSEWSDCVGQCFVDADSNDPTAAVDATVSPTQGRRVRSRAVLSHPGSPASQLACVSSLYETRSCDDPKCYTYEWQVRNWLTFVFFRFSLFFSHFFFSIFFFVISVLFLFSFSRPFFFSFSYYFFFLLSISYPHIFFLSLFVAFLLSLSRPIFIHITFFRFTIWTRGVEGRSAKILSSWFIFLLRTILHHPLKYLSSPGWSLEQERSLPSSLVSALLLFLLLPFLLLTRRPTPAAGLTNRGHERHRWLSGRRPTSVSLRMRPAAGSSGAWEWVQSEQ